MKLARGAGLSGLGGIYPRHGQRIRPLLDVSREELRALLQDSGESWVEDETNADPGYLRNRVRRTVVPALIETFGPSFLEECARSAVQAGEDGRWIDEQGASALAGLARHEPYGTTIDLEALAALPGPVRDRVLLFAMR